jgi:hypothetical protein
VAALTNGSVDKVARPVLEGGGAAGLVGEGALLDINMAQVNGACGSVCGGGGAAPPARDCGRGAVAEKGLPVSVASHICGSVEQQATSPHALVCLHAGGCAPPTQQNM